MAPVTNNHCVKLVSHSMAYIISENGFSLALVMAWRLFGTKPLHDLIRKDPLEQTSLKFEQKYKIMFPRKCISKLLSVNYKPYRCRCQWVNRCLMRHSILIISCHNAVMNFNSLKPGWHGGSWQTFSNAFCWKCFWSKYVHYLLSTWQ